MAFGVLCVGGYCCKILQPPQKREVLKVLKVRSWQTRVWKDYLGYANANYKQASVAIC